MRAWFCWVPVLFLFAACHRSGTDEFTRLTNVGKNYFDKGEAEKAVTTLQQALALNPNAADAQLNLANAYLLANQPENALKYAQEVARLDRNSATAQYLVGCADLRLGQARPALQALQQAKDIDRTVNAVSFQLGRAYQQLGNFEEAAGQFQEVIQFEPTHPAAHYNLSQVLLRLGKDKEANQELAEHQKILAGKPSRITDPSVFERCSYTQIRAPFRLEQPEARGVKVTFADVTSTAFGPGAKNYHGPVGVIDLRHDGRNSLFLMESNGFRLLLNTNGAFQPFGRNFPGADGVKYASCLVGDLNNDRCEDVVVLGDKEAKSFRFTTNGLITDVSGFSRLSGLGAASGVLADLNYSRKLDLLAVEPSGNRVRFFRNLGPYFSESVTNLNLPETLSGVRQLLVDDWNNDDLQDVFIAREGQPPLLLTKERTGPLTFTNSPADWPVGSVIAVGDLNNDLRSDLVVASPEKMVCVFNEVKERATIPLGSWQINGLTLLDYDNDGWLDIIATGDGLRVWRNRGNAGFEEVTRQLGLDKLVKTKVQSITAADFDQDGDTDLLVVLQDQSLQLLRNDGGNSNQQIKLHLIGTKSNTSALGTRLEVNAGGLRLSRRISTLPIEIGVGKNKQLDSLTVHWFDFPMNAVDVKVEPRSVLALLELEQQGGSCPYLYAWDGQRFRFITDILSASPLGLPLGENRFIEADTEELAWIGNDKMFPPREGNFVLLVTEELREVLYLDQAKLTVVDHPPGTEVHTTSKLRPGKPYAPHEIVTLHQRKPLLKATRSNGEEVTTTLAEMDGKFVSPPKLRPAQLRGLAEPHSLTLDFGSLETERPLVLALTGWLRFGGGTANVAASQDPDLPFPFPTLEVETASGAWQPVDVVVGAPAGKIKSIVVDLTGKLPAGSKRLRLTEAFELHWDRIALFERRAAADTKMYSLTPAKTDLHWRGYSDYSEVPGLNFFLPVYDQRSAAPPWRITPAGWCTRYGNVDALVNQRDNALALVNAGDELTLSFAANQVPVKSSTVTRDFFLFSVGWEKDSDFHVTKGVTVEPLPWHGMDDQLYGQQQRPAFPSDELMKKYNTRWVGPYSVTRGK